MRAYGEVLSVHKSCKASQASCVMGAAQPPAPLADAPVAQSFPQGPASKFVCSKGASPVTRRSSSNRAPFTRHRLHGARVAGHVEAGECSSPESEGERGVLPKTHPRVYCQTLPAFVSSRRKSYKASARCASVADEPTCTSENCRTLRMTRSSM